MSDAAVKIESLSAEERLDLLERLWDSLARTPADIPVTPEQRAELDRRLDELDRDTQEGGELGVPWDEVRSSSLAVSTRHVIREYGEVGDDVEQTDADEASPRIELRS